MSFVTLNVWFLALATLQHSSTNFFWSSAITQVISSPLLRWFHRVVLPSLFLRLVPRSLGVLGVVVKLTCGC